MRTSKVLLLFGCAATFLYAVLYVTRASCPECFQNFKPVPDDGSRSANGRPIIKLKLGGQFDVTPGHSDGRIFNAVSGAVNAWNTATNAEGRGAHYEIAFNQQTQNSDDSAVNIRIVKDLPDSADAQTGRGVPWVSGPQGGPFNLHIPAHYADICTAEGLLQAIEHELGHIFGLYHNLKQVGSCRGDEQTIMKPRDPSQGCVQLNRAISQRDVQRTIDLAEIPGYANNECHAIYKDGTPVGDQDPGGGGGGYFDPTPAPYYPPTCYYFYNAVDFETCSRVDDGPRTCSYAGTRYFLEDVFCYY